MESKINIQWFKDSFTMDEQSGIILKNFFFYLENRERSEKIIPYGMLLEAEQEEISMEFLNLLEKEIKEKVSEDYQMISATECTIERNPKAVADSSHKKTIAVVHGLHAEGTVDQLKEMIQEHPLVIWIICAPKQTIQNRFRGDDELYYRLLPRHMHLEELGTEQISNRFLQQLSEEEYQIGEDFSDKLRFYVETIYEDADLKGRDFLQDLYRRVMLNMDERPGGRSYYREEGIMSAALVPYSRKVEERLKEIRNQALAQRESTKGELTGENTEQSAENGNLSEIKTESLESKTEQVEAIRIPDIKMEETHFNDLVDSKNVLILSMSTLPPAGAHYCMVENQNEITYQIFSGVSQLEPGTKLFLSKLAAQGIRPDKIIIMTTEETRKPNKKHEGKSAVDVYAANIRSFIHGEEEDLSKYSEELSVKLEEEGFSSPRLLDQKQVMTDLYKEKREGDILETDSEALNELSCYLDVQTINLNENPLQQVMDTMNALAKEKHVNLFLDLQGGQRTFMFTMFATLSMLRDKNVTIRDMFAVRYDRNYNMHPIEIVNSEYAIIDLVSGIRAFSRYGKVDELQKFLQARDIESGNETELLKTMKAIDCYMQINNPEGFTEELNKLSDNHMLDAENYDDLQFKLIVDELSDTYAPLMDSNHTVLDQIKWFEEKSFISSALTFIEDKIPSFLIGNEDEAIIKVIYDGSLTSKDIAGKCSGQNYYKPENNILNARGGLQKSVRREENDFYRKVCDHWAEKVWSSCVNDSAAIDFNDLLSCKARCRFVSRDATLKNDK